jgi:hypothetical protein
VSELVNRRVRRVLSPDEGETVWLRKLGIRFMIGGEETRGTFAPDRAASPSRADAHP